MACRRVSASHVASVQVCVLHSSLVSRSQGSTLKLRIKEQTQTLYNPLDTLSTLKLTSELDSAVPNSSYVCEERTQARTETNSRARPRQPERLHHDALLETGDSAAALGCPAASENGLRLAVILDRLRTTKTKWCINIKGKTNSKAEQRVLSVVHGV